MALTYCHECGREISSTAKACPGCGAPKSALGQMVAVQRAKQGLSPALPEPVAVNKGCGLALLVAVVLIFGTCAYNEFSERNRRSALGLEGRAAEDTATARKAALYAARIGAKVSISTSLRDPNSVTFTNGAEYWKGDTMVLCGTYNAKNGFGAYNGPQWWMQVGAALYTEEQSGTPRRAREFKRRCRITPIEPPPVEAILADSTRQRLARERKQK